jgi:hypothetical protein
MVLVPKIKKHEDSKLLFVAVAHACFNARIMPAFKTPAFPCAYVRDCEKSDAISLAQGECADLERRDEPAASFTHSRCRGLVSGVFDCCFIHSSGLAN